MRQRSNCQIDGEDAPGCWPGAQPEEEKSVKHEEVSIIDQEGYELAKRSRRLDHFVPEVFALDTNSSKGFARMDHRKVHRKDCIVAGDAARHQKC